MKKALLYIDSMQKGGAQRVMSVLGKYLCDKNVETILINDILPEQGKAEYPIDSRIRRLFLDQGMTSWKNFYRVKRLHKIVKTEKPDVVLSFLGPPNYRMLVATLGLHCRKVVSVRNDPYREYGNSRIKKAIAGALFHLADGCVFQTEMASEYFPNSVRRKSKVIFNPVMPKFFNKQWDGRDNSVITVGRLVPQKNHALLIRAFAEVHKVLPDISLKLYGKGTEERSLRELARELGIENCIQFMGEISNVEDELRHGRCFVLSSDFEGMPNALMEAMAVGMPVISTDCPCGGPGALIKQEQNGILVPCGDADILADAIVKMMSSETMRSRMSVAAKKTAMEFHTDKIMVEWCQYLDASGENKR